MLTMEPKQCSLKWGWFEVSHIDGDSECSVCSFTIQLQKVNLGFKRTVLFSLGGNEREWGEREREGIHIHTHRTYSWDRQPSIMVSGKIGFSASSTDQESKHVSFHLTVGCKVISRSNVTSRRHYFQLEGCCACSRDSLSETISVMEA